MEEEKTIKIYISDWEILMQEKNSQSYKKVADVIHNLIHGKD